MPNFYNRYMKYTSFTSVLPQNHNSHRSSFRTASGSKKRNDFLLNIKSNSLVLRRKPRYYTSINGMLKYIFSRLYILLSETIFRVQTRWITRINEFFTIILLVLRQNPRLLMATLWNVHPLNQYKRFCVFKNSESTTATVLLLWLNWILIEHRCEARYVTLSCIVLRRMWIHRKKSFWGIYHTTKRLKCAFVYVQY